MKFDNIDGVKSPKNTLIPCTLRIFQINLEKNVQKVKCDAFAHFTM